MARKRTRVPETAHRTRRPLAICCVADSKPKYLFEALRLAQSILLNPAYQEFADLFIGVFADAPVEYVAEYRALGATVLNLEKYTDKHGPSNKLVVLTDPLLESYDYVALVDCDLLPIERFDELLDFDGVQAKLADVLTLDGALLEDAFNLFGMAVPDARWRTSLDDMATTCYCNTGCIIFSRGIFRQFVTEWFRVNDILLDNKEVLRRRSFFLDQASFCVCLSKFLDKFRPLPLYMNFPGHLPTKFYSTDAMSVVPKLVHYHDRVDAQTGALDLTDLPNLQKVVAQFNETTADLRAALHGRPLFWDMLHASVYQSGTRRSRDAGALAIVRSAVASLECRTILDLGCGIFSPSGLENRIDYKGVDFSPEAIRLSRQSRPQYAFEVADIGDLGEQERADLVLLLDVISENEEATTASILQNAVDRSGVATLVSWQASAGDTMEARRSGLERLSSRGQFKFVGKVGSELFFLCLRDGMPPGGDTVGRTATQ